MPQQHQTPCWIRMNNVNKNEEYKNTVQYYFFLQNGWQQASITKDSTAKPLSFQVQDNSTCRDSYFSSQFHFQGFSYKSIHYYWWSQAQLGKATAGHPAWFAMGFSGHGSVPLHSASLHYSLEWLSVLILLLKMWDHGILEPVTDKVFLSQVFIVPKRVFITLRLVAVLNHLDQFIESFWFWWLWLLMSVYPFAWMLTLWPRTWRMLIGTFS